MAAATTTATSSDRTQTTKDRKNLQRWGEPGSNETIICVQEKKDTNTWGQLERESNDAALFDKVIVYDPQDLPDDVKDELASLAEELEQGDITHQGFSKRKYALLERYSQQHEPPSTLNEEEENPLVELIEPHVSELPSYVVAQLEELQREYDNEELTLKGYSKRRLRILEHYMLKEPPLDNLPPPAQEKLKELEAELEDGDITEKGFHKKRKALMKPFLIPVNPLLFRRKRKLPSEKKINNNPSTKRPGPSNISPRAIFSEPIDVDGVKFFKCSVCGEVFKQPQSFSAHCRTHRGSALNSVKCDHCDATFTTKSHLKIHMFKHTGQYPFVCGICGKGFGQRGNLRVHEERHSKKQCEYCGAVFVIRSRFNNHHQACRKRYLASTSQNENTEDTQNENETEYDNTDAPEDPFNDISESQSAISNLNSDTEIAIELTSNASQGEYEGDIQDSAAEVIGHPSIDSKISIDNIKMEVNDNTSNGSVDSAIQNGPSRENVQNVSVSVPITSVHD